MRVKVAFLLACLAWQGFLRVHAQEGVEACSSADACGSEDATEFVAALPDREIEGVNTAFFACQCTDGRRVAISDDGTIAVPLSDAPSPPPSPPPPPPAPTARPDGFDVTEFLRIIQRNWFNSCADDNIDAASLALPNSDPRQCNTAIVIGSVCAEPCRYAIQALGEECYSRAIAREVADPELVGSNATIAFEQCVNGQPYTTVEQYLSDRGIEISSTPEPTESSDDPTPTPETPESSDDPTPTPETTESTIEEPSKTEKPTPEQKPETDAANDSGDTNSASSDNDEGENEDDEKTPDTTSTEEANGTDDEILPDSGEGRAATIGPMQLLHGISVVLVSMAILL